MKVIEIRNIVVTQMVTDDDDFSQYTRLSKDNWIVTKGVTEESVNNPEEMEELYQEYINEGNPFIK